MPLGKLKCKTCYPQSTECRRSGSTVHRRAATSPRATRTHTIHVPDALPRNCLATCVTQPCQTARASTAIGPPPARSLPLSCVIGAQAPPDTAVRRRGSHARRGRFGGAGQRAAGGYGCRPSHRRGAVVRARPSPPQLFRGALVRRASSQQPKRAHGRWHRAQPLCWRNCGRTQPHRSRAAREAQGTPRPSPPAQHTRAPVQLWCATRAADTPRRAVADERDRAHLLHPHMQILYQIQHTRPPSVWQALVTIGQKEGFRGYFRGAGGGRTRRRRGGKGARCEGLGREP